MCIACKTYPIYHRRVIWKVTRCFFGNRTVTPPAFGEQLTKRAQNLRLPAAHHKIKGLRAKEPSLPDMLQSPCAGVRGQKQMQLFLPQPLQWQELTNLWSRGRMLCLQPADICKLLLQRCAWFQALGITAYGFCFFFFFDENVLTLYAPISFFFVFANSVPLLNASTVVVLLPYIWRTQPHSRRGSSSLYHVFHFTSSTNEGFVFSSSWRWFTILKG